MLIEPKNCENAANDGGGVRARGTSGSGGRALHIILALLGVGGIVIVLLSTWRYGIGTFPDAEHYVGAARSLLDGKGYRYYFGEPYTRWPPLFPTLLAGLGLVRIEPLAGARLLNSLAFGLTVFLSGVLCFRCTRSRLWAVAGAAAVLASKPSLDWSVMAASEPIFTVLMVLFGLCLPHFLRRGNLASLLLAALVAALACLQRYAGVSLVLAGAVLSALYTPCLRLLRKFVYLVIFGAIALAPVALWCVRNRRVAGQPVGNHSFNPQYLSNLVDVFHSATRTMAVWVFPGARSGLRHEVAFGLIMLLALAAIIGVLIRDSRRRASASAPASDAGREDINAPYLWSALVIAAAYFGFIVASGALLGWFPEQRHMVPLCPFVAAVIVTALESLRRLGPAGMTYGRPVTGVLIVLGALWLGYPCRVLYRNTAARMRNGAGGCATAVWQNSPLVQWLRDNPLPGKLYCNGTDNLYLLTGKVSWLTPQWRDSSALAGFAKICTTGTRYLIWFNEIRYPRLYDLREILSRVKMQEVARFPDGCVYRCLGEGGAELGAVYRLWSPKTGRHFCTIDKHEWDKFRKNPAAAWVHEAVVFYAFAAPQPGTCPVYHFSSPRQDAHYYTADAAEKERLMQDPAGAWVYRDVAFYAYPARSVEGLTPVYRVLSRRLGDYVYTADEREKNKLVNEGSGEWSDEGIAWYAYGLQP